jgi:hypothetical protein
MYSDAGQPDEAVHFLKALLRQADEKPASYQRLPRNAVEREMRVLETRLHDVNQAASAAYPNR